MPESTQDSTISKDEHTAPTEPSVKSKLTKVVDKISDEALANNGFEIRTLFDNEPLKFDCKVGSKQQRITISLDRVIRFFSQPENRKYLLALKMDRKSAADRLKEKVELALKQDIEQFMILRRTELPIFGFESHFQILELDLTNPGTAIKEALEHIMFMHKVRTERAGKRTLPFHKRLFYRSTALLLNASYRVTRFFEDGVNAVAGESAIKVFLKLIERFWINQVGRPKYNKGVDGEDDYWSFPSKGDDVLRKTGFYPLSIRPNPERHSYRNNHETVAAGIWATLREQVLHRQTAAKNGESVTPLPKRKKEGYWVVVESDPRSDRYFRKIHIPYDLLFSENATFVDFYHHYLTQMTTTDAPLLTGPETYDETDQLVEEDIFYDSDEHKRNRQDYANFADADLRVVVDSLSSGSTKITRYFKEPKYNPAGTRTPTVLVLSVFKNGSTLGQATSMNAHAPLDGKRSETELRAIVQAMESVKIQAGSKKTLEFSNKLAEIQQLEMQLIRHKKTEVFRPVTDEYQESLSPNEGGEQESDSKSGGIATYEAHLGSDIRSSEDAVIDTLLDTFKNDGGLNEYFEKEYGTKVDIYAVFSWAICLTLGISDVHFLEADGNGLTPIALSLPLALEDILEASQHQEIEKVLDENPLLIKTLVDTIAQFGRGRAAAKRSITEDGKIKIGMGAVEVLKVTSGNYRRALSLLAGITIPYGSQITTESLLISAMAGTRRRSKGFTSSDIRAFGTADDSVYRFGGVGFTDFAEGAWRVVLREGREDALRKKVEQEDIYFSDEVQQVVQEYCDKRYMNVPTDFPLPNEVLSAIFTYLLRKNLYFVISVFAAAYGNHNKKPEVIRQVI